MSSWKDGRLGAARRQVPNLVTASRIVAGLALLWPAFTGRTLVLVAWGAASDFIDGFVARRWRLSTRFGAAFDLGADGVFFLSAFTSYWRAGSLPDGWYVLILLAALPEAAAQAVMLFSPRRPIGSPHRSWNRLLGGYSYACVLAIALGFPAVPFAAAQVALELLANGLDLFLALKGSGWRCRFWRSTRSRE